MYAPPRPKIVVASGLAATPAWVAAGASRPRPALPAARHSANAIVSARRRSRPGASCGPPSRSMITPLVPDVDDPLLAEEVERRGPALTVAEARVLHAAERHLRFTAQRRYVHVKHAGLGFLR